MKLSLVTFGGELSEKVFRPREAFRPKERRKSSCKLDDVQQNPSLFFYFAQFLEVTCFSERSENFVSRVARSNGKADVQNDGGSINVEICSTRDSRRCISPQRYTNFITGLYPRLRPTHIDNSLIIFFRRRPEDLSTPPRYIVRDGAASTSFN